MLFESFVLAQPDYCAVHFVSHRSFLSLATRPQSSLRRLIQRTPPTATQGQNLMQVLGVYFGLTSAFCCKNLPGTLSHLELLQPPGLTH